MKVLILAGGLGTRLGEETSIKPKPMVEIGGQPILWHIMKIYSNYGFNDFVVLTGYKQEVIKNYFLNYYSNNSNMTINLANGAVTVNETKTEPWRVTLLFTGIETLTAGRIKQAQTYVGNERFMLTYGDGVGNVNITELLKSHQTSGKLATLTAYQPEGRYGTLDINSDGSVTRFKEKPKQGGSWINAGFFVCEPEVFDYIPENSNNIMFEREPLQSLSHDGKLNSYKHSGFWQPMDMLKDKVDLNAMWASGNAPWKVWSR